MAANPTLTTLDVSSNDIRNAGARALAANARLVSLDLRNNRMEESGTRALLANRTLSLLGVSLNCCGQRLIAELMAWANRNGVTMRH